MKSQTKETVQDEFITASQAAKINHTTRQAIYAAIHKGRLKKINTKYGINISADDLASYMCSKYSRASSIFEGELIFDKAKGHYSVNEIAKLLNTTTQRVYYDIRSNRVKVDRKGYHYVINEEELKCYGELLKALYSKRNNK